MSQPVHPGHLVWLAPAPPLRPGHTVSAAQAASDPATAGFLPDALPAPLTADAASDAVLAQVTRARVHVAFDRFVDGRGMTHARTLIEAGFQGTLVATGDIGLDQLDRLRRVGFTHAWLKAGEDPQAAARQLTRYPAHYRGIRTTPGLGAPA